MPELGADIPAQTCLKNNASLNCSIKMQGCMYASTSYQNAKQFVWWYERCVANVVGIWRCSALLSCRAYANLQFPQNNFVLTQGYMSETQSDRPTFCSTFANIKMWKNICEWRQTVCFSIPGRSYQDHLNYKQLLPI